MNKLADSMMEIPIKSTIPTENIIFHSPDKKKYKEEINLVVGSDYGDKGISPCHVGCNCFCISGSGERYCTGYFGHDEVYAGKTKYYIVKCLMNVSCEKSR